MHTRLLKRFIAKITKREPTECWEWAAYCNKDGYGVIGVGGKKTALAHRIMWEIHHDEAIPKGMIVMHSCDNPSCCNPNHLKLATRRENMEDMARKGRAPWRNVKSSNNPNAKVTEEQRQEIRRIYAADSVSQASLGERYGLSQTAVSKIVRGNRPARKLPWRAGDRNHASKVTDAQRREIFERYEKGGESSVALGREFGVVPSTVLNIVYNARKKLTGSVHHHDSSTDPPHHGLLGADLGSGSRSL